MGNLADADSRFREADEKAGQKDCRKHRSRLDEVDNALMMEAVSPSETPLIIYQTTQCYIPEDSHLYVNFVNTLL
jgi:hypothetical protein